MTDDRGSITIWMLGLSLLLLLFGGIALDYWRGLALQRELAAVADSAAIAAASGISETHYRLTGDIVLDPDRAQRLALELIDFQDLAPNAVTVSVAPDGLTVSVTIEGVLHLGLLGALVRDETPLTVRATARAGPRFVP